MKKTSKDSTLDFFGFLSKNLFPKFELLNSVCDVSVGLFMVYVAGQLNLQVTLLQPPFVLTKIEMFSTYNQWQKFWDTHHLKLVFLLSLKNCPLPPRTMLPIVNIHFLVYFNIDWGEGKTCILKLSVEF